MSELAFALTLNRQVTTVIPRGWFIRTDGYG